MILKTLTTALLVFIVLVFIAQITDNAKISENTKVVLGGLVLLDVATMIVCGILLIWV